MRRRSKIRCLFYNGWHYQSYFRISLILYTIFVEINLISDNEKQADLIMNTYNYVEKDSSYKNHVPEFDTLLIKCNDVQSIMLNVLILITNIKVKLSFTHKFMVF